MDIANLAKHIHPPPHSVSVAFQIRPFTVRQREVWGDAAAAASPPSWHSESAHVLFHFKVQWNLNVIFLMRLIFSQEEEVPEERSVVHLILES